jgi:hypothetical protein
MAKDWSYAALDDLLLSGQLKRAVEPRFYAERQPRRDLKLGLAGLCLLVGAMAALLYVWPVLLLAHFVHPMRHVVFWSILAGAGIVAAVAAFAVALYERGYWAENWQNVSDWADPAWK